MKLQWICCLWLLALVGPRSLYGQRTSGWERTDVFGNVNSLNAANQYPNFDVRNGFVTLAGAGPGGGYWAKYTLQGQLLWQKRARGALAALVGPAWRDGCFAYGGAAANNRIGFAGEYYWLTGAGDTARVRARPGVATVHAAQHAAMRDGRYYVAGLGDNGGTGQNPVSAHFSLVCLDTAGALRWQYNYPNPVIRISPQFPAAVAYAYLRRIVEAPRRGWWLLGDAQRDSVNFQLYAIEVDSGGRFRRARWVEPFGRAAHVTMYGGAGALRLRDGSGYVVSGQAQIDSLGGRARTHGFVARLDTALRVVWRVLVEAPPLGGGYTTTIRYTGGVQEAADGSLRVLTYPVTPRPVRNEFDVLHLSAQGRLTRRDTYCSQVLADAVPVHWQLLPGDTAAVFSGQGTQRDASGRLLTQPAWLASFQRPCRTQLVPIVTAARSASAAVAIVLYPQPAAPGARVNLHGTWPGAAQVHLVDALGRVVATLVAAVSQGEVHVDLPPSLPPGLYAMRVHVTGQSTVTARLLVQVP